MQGQSGRDRWSSLMEFAAKGGSSADVFYRWVDYLDRPINAEEYRRDKDAYVLYEDSEGRWHLEGASKSTRKLPRRLFADKNQAQAFLSSQSFSMTKLIPVLEFSPEPDDPTGWPNWLGWLLFSMLLIAVFVVLVLIMWNIDKADMTGVSP